VLLLFDAMIKRSHPREYEHGQYRRCDSKANLAASKTKADHGGEPEGCGSRHAKNQIVAPEDGASTDESHTSQNTQG
jgi:hypothetical protein